MIKYLKWFLLICKTFILHKTNYSISFTKEKDNRWYVDFPEWPLSHDNLEMVAGADDLLDLLNNKKTNKVFLEIDLKRPQKDSIQLKKVHSAITKGAFYVIETPLKGWERQTAIRRKQLWLCPVTLAVLGHYPKNIYIKQVNNDKYSFF